MSTVRDKIRIEAPVERVWETVMDPNQFKDWVTIHRAVRNVSPGRLAKGATMEQVVHVRGLTFKVHWELVAIEAPTHAEWHGGGPAHSAAKIRYDLTADGDNATNFEYTNEFTPPGGRLGSLASNMIVGAASEREAHNSLEKLKHLLERS
jgi:carbon monoxide dehydrogenase subunit G